MAFPSNEDVAAAEVRYLERTSNESMKIVVCFSCARAMWRSLCHRLDLTTVPHREMLKPRHPHPSHKLTSEGLLLELRHTEVENDRTFGYLCSDCNKSLSDGHLPRYALSNQMWIGDVPAELEGLTISEQILIALNMPRCYVYKLQPKGKKINDPSRLQRGFKGNVTTFPLNSQDVAKMLRGELMPRRPEVLASVIAVSFVGVGTLPKDWLRRTFRVRRQWVYESLRWLSVHNKLYHGLQIDEEALNELPEDDVPDALRAVVRQELNEDIVQFELDHTGYVPDAGDEEVDDEVELEYEDVTDEAGKYLAY